MAYQTQKIMEFESENTKPVGSLRGAILINDSGKKFLQLKLKNNSSQYLKELAVKIICRDEKEQQLGVQEYTYSGLFVAPGEIFGTRKAIPLEYENTDTVQLEFKRDYESLKVKSKLVKKKRINFEYLPLIAGCIAVTAGLLSYLTNRISIRPYNITVMEAFKAVFRCLPGSLFTYLAAFPLLYFICYKNNVERKWLDRIGIYFVSGSMLGFLAEYRQSISFFDYYGTTAAFWVIFYCIVIVVAAVTVKQVGDNRTAQVKILGVFVLGTLIVLSGYAEYGILLADIGLFAFLLKYGSMQDKALIGTVLLAKNLGIIADLISRKLFHSSFYSSLLTIQKFLLFVAVIAGLVALTQTQGMNKKITDR